jgi:pyruvate ferredoxin oxidoreductase gamma subunit
MREIRIHARAGQGAITTAVLLGQAYFLKGMYPYAFPHFGAARMGAPMNAFLRVDTKPVRLRSQIYEPDYVIVVDPTLMRGFNCLAGLKENGAAVINQGPDTEHLNAKLRKKIYVIPANEIALKTIGRPLANTCLLGAYAAITAEIDLDTLLEAVKTRLSDKAQEGNIAAVKEGFEFGKNLIK